MTQGQQPDRDPMSELQRELREMGTQLESAFRMMMESDRTKQIKSDLTAGIREISSQMRSTIEQAQHDPRLKEAEERGRKALEEARESKVVQEMQELFVMGVTQINQQLRKLVERIEAETRPSTPTQHVPVEQDPKTGETTKLD
ncbi:MAG: hypothetical protein Fur005_35380 [Roseiflexaceae bacterium]